MDCFTTATPSCHCPEGHENVIQFLNSKVEALYSYRDRFFENHKIEDAILKNEEVEKLLQTTKQIFNHHEGLIKDEDRAQYNFLIGKMLNVVPSYDKLAENYLSKAIKLDPKLVEAWNELGECYWKNDDIGKSTNCYERALKEQKNKISLRSLSMLARQSRAISADEKMKNIAKGLNYAKEAVQLDPQDGLSWAILGNAHLSSFFGIQQNPAILKKCLSAYAQAEKDLIARTTPDVHYNKGITLKYEEEYELALESFNNASMFDPTWDPPRLKEQQLVRYLKDIQEFAMSSGKMKAKRLQQLLQAIDFKQLGPYYGGSYTSTTVNETVKLELCKLSELKAGVNAEKVVLGKVVCSVRNEDVVPFTFCMVDKDGTCVVVTVFNLAAGKGYIIGDSVAIPEPFVTDVNFCYKGDKFDFRMIRVEAPVVLVVNGKKVTRDQQAGVTLSIFKKYD